MLTPYTVKLALQSLFRDKWINLLSVLTIAVGLFIMSLSLLFVYNLDRATKRLPEKFSLVIYLEEDLPQDRIQQVIDTLGKNSTVETIHYISKEKALEELRGTLQNSQYILDGLEGNPLPDTLELKLKQGVIGPEVVRTVADQAMKIEGVSEIDYGEQFLSTVYSLKKGLKTLGVFFIAVLSTGIIFVCYSTVKILFYRKNEEIETYKLLGATKGFISIPFLIEGAIIGTLGGMVSLIGVFVFHNIVLLRLIIAIPLFKSVFFPSTVFLVLPAIGLFLGITGAFIALGRIKY